jgi:N-acyl-D-amino-acid deacylase
MGTHGTDHLSDRRLSRRRTLHVGGFGAAAALAPRGLAAARRPQAASQESTPPSGSAVPTGQAVPELAAFDQLMLDLMATWNLPGGQLALAKDGRLVFDRGYGLADVEASEPVQPTSLFRIASVSKPITTVAILTLVDAGLLSLDDYAFRLLAGLQPPANAPRDPRLEDVTIEHLLVHAGGWDSTRGFDPQYQPWTWQHAGVLGIAHPLGAEEIVRAMLGVRLAFDPGARSVYSNFGFNVLGRVIEQVSGQSYEAYVQDRVLHPAGVESMRIGGTRLTERAPGEVRYYSPPGQAPMPSIFPGVGYAPFAYDYFFIPSLDAHGGWIASAADLVRFATAIDGQRGTALLQPATVDAMLQTPRPATEEGAAGSGNETAATGLGWIVQATDDGFEWSHAGALEGSNSAWLARLHDGVTIAFAFNTVPEGEAFFDEAISALRATAEAVTAWPPHDLFEDGTPSATPDA